MAMWDCSNNNRVLLFHLHQLDVSSLGLGTTTVGKSVVHPATVDLRGKLCESLSLNEYKGLSTLDKSKTTKTETLFKELESIQNLDSKQ
nr:hypothetical protein [Tanacetum cinerariifolium]